MIFWRFWWIFCSLRIRSGFFPDTDPQHRMQWLCLSCNYNIKEFSTASLDEAEDTIDQFMSTQGRKKTVKRLKKKGGKKKYPKNIYNVFCDLCDYVTYRRFHLVKHRRKIHDLDHDVKLNIKYNFFCNDCEFKAKNVGVMERHKKAKHLDPNAKHLFPCAKCNFLAPTSGHLEQHKEDAHNGDELLKEAKIACEKCDYVTPKIMHLIRHKRSIHKETIDKNDPLDYICTLCEHSTKDYTKLKGHFKAKHKGEEMISRILNPAGPKEEGLENGEETEQDPNKPSTFERFERKQCTQCDFSTFTSGILVSHINDVHGGAFKCNTCEHVASNYPLLRKHIKKIHMGVRFPCDLCDYIGTENRLLKQHKERKHEGRVYQCDQECIFTQNRIFLPHPIFQ